MHPSVRPIVSALALSFALPTLRSVAAQSAPAASSAAAELRVSAGRRWSGQVDESISSRHFIGSGFGAAAELRWIVRGTLFDASLTGGSAAIDPTSGANGSRERVSSGDLRLAAMRRLGGDASSSDGFAVGVGLRAMTSFTSHDIAAPQPISSQYLLGALSLGPRIAWRRQMVGGRIDATLGTDLVSLVDRPFGRIDGGRPPFALSVASLSRLRTGNAALSYSTGTNRRVGLVTTYTLDLLDYRDVQRVRTVAQSLAIGARLRLRGASR